MSLTWSCVVFLPSVKQLTQSGTDHLGASEMLGRTCKVPRPLGTQVPAIWLGSLRPLH